MESGGRGGWTRAAMLGVVVALFGALAFIAFRPATVLGIDRGPLGESVAGEADLARGDCVEHPKGGWRCTVTGVSDAWGVYRVHVHRFGCWDAVRVPRSASGSELSGCIGLADEIFSGAGDRGPDD